MIPGGVNELLLRSAAAGGATAGRSVRFNSADSAYLSRTPASAGNRTTWTWSGWVKRSALGSFQDIFSAGTSGTDYFTIRFKDTDNLDIFDRPSSGNVGQLVTSAVFRDVSAWYHIVYVWDTDNGTAADRRRLYVNGVRVTTFSTDSTPSSGAQSRLNSTLPHAIGRYNPGSSLYFDGYLALVHFIDGQALTPSSFGETSATTGQWIAKTYSGSYGTNGFFLDFLDNSTAAALGYDAAGSNDWTVNNIATGSNYSTNLTPASTAYPNTTLSNGGLTWTGSTTNDTGTVSSLAIPTNKKTYVEVTHTSTGGGDPGPGVANGPTVEMGLDTVKAWWRGGTNGSISASTLGAFTGGTTTWSNGDVLGIALDHTANSGAGSITFYKNGVQAWTGGSGWTSYNDLRFEWQNNGSGTDSGTWNYGLTAFSYPVAGHTGLFAPVGAGEDSLRDHPTSAGTNTQLGGEVSGNYCTLNPLAITNLPATPSNGNLETTGNRNSYGTIALPSSGKWYWEVTPTAGTDPMIGMAAYDSTTNSAILQTSVFYYINGNKYITGTGTAYGASYALNDVIGVAANIDAGTVTFYKNNTSQGAITFNAAGLFPASTTGGGSATYTFNFGQRAWSYTAPSGFSPLVDTLLPTPTIAKPNTVMDVKLYTGTGSSQNITGFNFSPDFIWTKARDSAVYSLQIIDIIRGGTNVLFSNLTDAEGTYQSISAFNSDGYTVSTNAGINGSGNSFVAWCWDAGSSNATNTSGTITSTVRANISAGFSVLTYTAPSSGSATIGHGLGVAPQFILCKDRSDSNPWGIYHTSLGVGKGLLFNTSAEQVSTAWWNNTNPTSTVFSVNTGIYATAQPNHNYVAYCWTPVAGLSSFGSYVGNGSSDGPFVYTGFRPAFVILKASNLAGQNWMMYDNKRGAYNLNSKKLAANESLEENNSSAYGGDSVGIDFLSNGFKIRTTGGNHNNNASIYIYACFAESPLPYARAR